MTTRNPVEPQPLIPTGGGELYLVPTVLIPPMSVPTGYATVPVVHPKTTNVQLGGYPTPVGAYRPNNPFSFQLIPNNLGIRTIPSTSGATTQVRVPQFYLRMVSAFTNPLTGADISPNTNFYMDPRFRVFGTYFGGVNRAWLNLSEVAGGASPLPANVDFVGAPRLLYMPDGSVLLFVATHMTSGGKYGNRLYVFRWDPRSEDSSNTDRTQWFVYYARYPSGINDFMQEAVASSAGGDTLGLTPSTTPTAEYPGLNDFEPFLVGSIPYVILSLAYPDNQLRLLRLIGTTFIDTQLRLPINTIANSPSTASHLDGGVAAARLAQGQDIFAFTYDRGGATTHRRSIHIVNTSHFSVATTSQSRAKLPILSGYQALSNKLPPETTCVAMLRPRQGIYPTEHETNFYHATLKTMGWAGTSLGEVYFTNDGGLNWAKVSTPTEKANTKSHTPAPIRAISAVELDTSYDADSGRIAVMAVGDQGLVVTCVWLPLSGAVQLWKVLRYNPSSSATMFNSADTWYAGTASSVWPATDWKCVYGVADDGGTNKVRFWVGGSQGTIFTALASNGDVDPFSSATVFYFVCNRGSSGAYTGIVGDKTHSVILAVGDAGVHDGVTVAEANRTARAVKLSYSNTNWTAGTLTESWYLKTDDTSEEPASPLVGITRLYTADRLTLDATAYAYTVSRNGKLYRWDQATVTFVNFGDLGPSAEIHSIDIARNFSTPSDTSVSLYVGGKTTTIPGVVWRTDTAAVATNLINIDVGYGLNPTFTAQLLPNQDIPVAIGYEESPDAGVVITASETYFSINTTHSRANPSLLVTSTGAVLLADDNITLGRVEVFYANTFSPTGYPNFQLVDTGFSFAARDDSSISNLFRDTTYDIPRPDLAEDIDGTIVLSVGASHRLSIDGGRSWVSQTDRILPIPLRSLSTQDTLSYMGTEAAGGSSIESLSSASARFEAVRISGRRSIRPTRSLCALPGGQFASAAYNNDLTQVAIFIARQWYGGVSSSSTYMPLPVITGREQALVDSLRVQWLGDQIIDGNEWTVTADSLYPAKNILSDSPRAEWWRSIDYTDRNTTGTGPTVLFGWHRSGDPNAVALLGKGTVFDVCGLFMKGINFQKARLQLFDEFHRTVALKDISTVRYSGEISSISSLSNYVLIDATATWIPHQFAPAFDQYYITLKFQGAPYQAFRILDNTEQQLMLGVAPNNVILDTGQLPTVTDVAYEIWSDTLFWDGENADFRDSSFSGLPNSLRQTNLRFCQQINLSIPSQPTVDGYFAIGTLRLGVFVMPTPPSGSSDSARHHSPDWQWTPIPNTLEEASLSGVTTVEHFQQTQEWALTYASAPDWYRARLAQAFLRESRMRQAFCWVPNKDDNAVPPRLVRLIDGPPVRGVALSYATIELRLREVR